LLDPVVRSWELTIYTTIAAKNVPAPIEYHMKMRWYISNHAGLMLWIANSTQRLRFRIRSKKRYRRQTLLLLVVGSLLGSDTYFDLDSSCLLCADELVAKGSCPLTIVAVGEAGEF